MIRLESRAHQTATMMLKSEMLREGINEITVLGLSETNDARNLEVRAAFVNWIKVLYTREANARAPSFEFSAEGVAQVSELVGSAPQVFDLSVANAPKKLAGFAHEAGQIAFEGDGRYLVVTDEGVKEPVLVRGVHDKGMSEANQEVDYLVITHHSLMDGAKKLADLRQEGGLKTKVVDVQDVFDAYAGGVPNPWAIRDYLRFARDTWKVAPSFVVLVGKGTFDYRDIQGVGDNAVPPALLRTVDGLYASDLLLTDLDENGRGDIAVGRLPVTDNAQLEALVEKYRSFEFDQAGRSVFVQDESLAHGDFASLNGELAARASDNSEVISLDENTIDEVRSQVQNAWSQGPSVLSYLGHGGNDRMGRAEILGQNDVSGLLADSGLPIVLAWSCAINRFDIPGYASLGENLLLQGKAAAIIAPTGTSNHFRVGELAHAFFDGLADEPTLGEAFLQSHGATPDNMIKTLGDQDGTTFVLLGDPALPLRGDAFSRFAEGGVSEAAGPVADAVPGSCRTTSGSDLSLVLLALSACCLVWRRRRQLS